MTYNILPSKPTIIQAVIHYYDYKNDNWLEESALGVTPHNDFTFNVSDFDFNASDLDIRSECSRLHDLRNRIDDGKSYLRILESNVNARLLEGTYNPLQASEVRTGQYETIQALNVGLWPHALTLNSLSLINGAYDSTMKSDIGVYITNYINNNY